LATDIKVFESLIRLDIQKLYDDTFDHCLQDPKCKDFITGQEKQKSIRSELFKFLSDNTGTFIPEKLENDKMSRIVYIYYCKGITDEAHN